MSDLIQRADAFAERWFIKHDCRRKYTGEPYMVHPREVAAIVASLPQCSLDTSVIAAALLHDTVEDTDCPLSLIEEEFGADIAEMVEWLTDVSKPEDGNRAARKAIDREHVAKAPSWVQTIKLADLISNTSTITRYDPEFAKVYLAEKRELLKVLTRGNPTLHAVATALAKE